MFEDKIVGGIVRGLVLGILDAFSDAELEDLISRTDSDTNHFASDMLQFIDPHVEQQLRSYVSQYSDRLPEILNLRKIYLEAKNYRPSLCSIIERNQDWFKAWMRSLRAFGDRGFTGSVAPQ